MSFQGCGRQEAGPRKDRIGPGSPGQMGLVYNCKPQAVLSTDLMRGSGMMYYNTPFMGVLSSNVH